MNTASYVGAKLSMKMTPLPSTSGRARPANARCCANELTGSMLKAGERKGERLRAASGACVEGGAQQPERAPHLPRGVRRRKLRTEDDGVGAVADGGGSPGAKCFVEELLSRAVVQVEQARARVTGGDPSLRCRERRRPAAAGVAGGAGGGVRAEERGRAADVLLIRALVARAVPQAAVASLEAIFIEGRHADGPPPPPAVL